MANTVTVSVLQTTASASEAHSRDHRIVMDRPETKGGANVGPMGGEVLLMALGGCFMSNLLSAAAARKVTLLGTQLTIGGTLADAPPRFAAVEMTVAVNMEDREAAKKLVTIAERGCIVANTLKSSVELRIKTVIAS